VKAEEKKLTWQEIAWFAAKVGSGIILLLLLFPLLYLMYRLMRVAFASKGTARADQVYLAALYRFHMAGIEREGETPLEYAEKKIDPTLSTPFAEFMRMYLRLKYAPGNLKAEDYDLINRFSSSAGPSIRRKNGFFKTTLNYFNLLRAFRYFQQSQPTEDNQTL